MTKFAMVGHALYALEEATAGEVSAFVRKRYGVHIPPMFVMLLVARLHDKVERHWLGTREDSSCFALEA